MIQLISDAEFQVLINKIDNQNQIVLQSLIDSYESIIAKRRKESELLTKLLRETDIAKYYQLSIETNYDGLIQLNISRGDWKGSVGFNNEYCHFNPALDQIFLKSRNQLKSLDEQLKWSLNTQDPAELIVHINNYYIYFTGET